VDQSDLHKRLAAYNEIAGLLPEADMNRRMTRRIGFLFVARNGLADAVATCPLLMDERTWLGRGSMSEIDPDRTSAG
jgi:hypothetical protein